MPITPGGRFSPADSDDWDLTTDLAAMQVSNEAASATDISGALAALPPEKFISGTASDRAALTQRVSGRLFLETDTGLIFEDRVTSWAQRLVGPAYNEAPVGAAVLSLPAAAVNLPRGLIIKTGTVRGAGSPAFGNSYLPGVTFATPFPTATVSVQVTQIQTTGVTAVPNLAVDTVDRTQFRAFFPGSSSTAVSAYMWMAVGY